MPSDGLFGEMTRAAPADLPSTIGTVIKPFRRNGEQYAKGDAYPKGRDRVETIAEWRGLIAAQLVEPDRIPHHSQRPGEGYANPRAVPRAAR